MSGLPSPTTISNICLLLLYIKRRNIYSQPVEAVFNVQSERVRNSLDISTQQKPRVPTTNQRQQQPAESAQLLAVDLCSSDVITGDHQF